MGVVPLGVMLEGALGSVIGVPDVVIMAGIVSVLVVGLTIAYAPKVRAMA
jgi:hypothetical protein